MEEYTSIPYFAHEGMMARNERLIKKLIIALIVTIGLVFASNALWLYAWMRYDYMSTETTSSKEVEVDAKDGIANYIGNDGDITNGTDTSDNYTIDNNTQADSKQ